MKDFRIPSDVLTERRIGAVITARDERGIEYRARIIALEDENVLVHPFEKLILPSESTLFVALIQALPKKEKMEWIIQKATELGVSAIIPCVSEKSITLDERNRLQTKSHRWQEIARKATEQSRRRIMPTVSPCVPLGDALKTHAAEDPSLRLILYERERETKLGDLTWDGIKSLIIACGPEGGFSEGDVAIAREFGYVPVSMGGRILRCETAALAVLAIIQFLSGNL